MHLRCRLSAVTDIIGVLACDFLDLTIVHAEPSGAIFLGNQNNTARPAALAWLDNALVQHFSGLQLFPHLFSDGKSSGWEAYGIVFPCVNSVNNQVSLSHTLWATTEYIPVLINGRC